MQLYLIRHAQSTNNLLRLTTGSDRGRSVDAELSETGRRQAELLGRHLAGGKRRRRGDKQNREGYRLDFLYTSLMVRSVETAAAVARHTGLTPVAWPEVHERGGLYVVDEGSGQTRGAPGNPRSLFQRRWPQLALPEELDQSGWWNRPFEEPAASWARAAAVLAELLRRHGGSDHGVAIVTHGGFLQELLRRILRMPERAPVWFSCNNASISRIDFLADHAEVVYLNRADFFPPELVSGAQDKSVGAWRSVDQQE